MRTLQHVEKFIQPLAVETQAGEIEIDGLPVQQTHDHRFAEAGGHRRHPQVQLLALDAQHDPAILRQTTLGDVQPRHDLHPGNNRRRRTGRWRFGLMQHAVDAIAHF